MDVRIHEDKPCLRSQGDILYFTTLIDPDLRLGTTGGEGPGQQFKDMIFWFVLGECSLAYSPTNCTTIAGIYRCVTRGIHIVKVNCFHVNRFTNEQGRMYS